MGVIHINQRIHWLGLTDLTGLTGRLRVQGLQRDWVTLYALGGRWACQGWLVSLVSDCAKLMEGAGMGL